MVCCAVFTHEAGAVDAECYGQPHQRHVVDHLVVGSLEERGIDGYKRTQPLLCQAAGESHRMLLGDAYVEHAARIRLLEDAHRGAGGHCGGDAYYFGVLLGQFDHRMAEHVLEFHRGAFGMAFAAQRPCGGVEFAGGVPCGRVGLGRREPFPFSGLDVEQTRPAHPLDVVEGLYQRGHVVAVDRTEIAYVKTLEYVLLAREQRFQTVVEAHDRPLLAVRHQVEAAQKPVERIAEVVVALRGGDVSQIVVE